MVVSLKFIGRFFNLMWLSKQTYVNKDSIFVFGHSIGGGMSLLLSLYPNLPVNKAGSCAGLYPPETFIEWAEEEASMIPFNPKNELEVLLRCPVEHLYYLMRPHQMYIGKEDGFSDYKEYLKEYYRSNREQWLQYAKMGIRSRNTLCHI